MRAALVKFFLSQTSILIGFPRRVRRRPTGDARLVRAALILLLVAVTGGRLAGEPAPTPVPAQMHIMVEADRVRIGETEWVPRFLNLPSVLVVPAGQVVTLSPQSTYDYIEVAGTLRVSRTSETTVRFTHLLILPGGVLDAGTETNPVLRRVEFVMRDVPIDTRRDPFQWGNGLINFGTQTRVGGPKTPFAELAADAPAGVTTLALTAAPVGWAVGDELLLPDMGQMNSRGSPRRESPVTIAAIAGAEVTLSKPLDFAHAAVRDPDGGLVLRPRVANLTRNIVIRSEAPAGVRGHTANIGHDAAWDIRGNQFVGVGRTQAATLDNTAPDLSHIGSNQIGKYADHAHHAGDAVLTRRHTDNVFLGTGGSKWALVVHATDGVTVTDNVCVDFQGGCFATEDGHEAGSVFRRNVAAYSTGNDVGARRNVRGLDCPGCEGAGFWFRGVAQTIEANEAWNNVVGLTLFNVEHVLPPPGFEPSGALPVAFDRNVTLGNTLVGLEYWGMSPFPARNHASAHNGQRQVWAGVSDTHIYLVDPTLIAAGAKTDCIASSGAYVATLEVEGGQLRGCARGISGGLADKSGTVRDTVMQNEKNIVLGGNVSETLLDGVQHLPLGTLPRQYVLIETPGPVWAPGQPLPRYKNDHWTKQGGSTIALVNWQGTGRNYRLLAAPYQDRDVAAWPAAAPAHAHLVPEAGLTMGQAWDKYGMALRGDVYVSSQVESLEGVIGAVARPGLDRPLGLPRAVLTYPNMQAEAAVEGYKGVPAVRLWFTLTGLPSAATNAVVLSIDGGTPIRLTRPTPAPVVFQHMATAASPGIHEVKTWREDLSGNTIRTSELTFRYVVGEGPPR